MNDWKFERTHTIRTRQALPVSFSLCPAEEAFFTSEASDEAGGSSGPAAPELPDTGRTVVSQSGANQPGANQSGLGFALTPYYFSLIGAGQDDPVRLQCIPRRDELEIKPYEVQDPLDEKHYSPLPRMVHRYPDRVLVLVTDECAVYCRHCFRRYFSSQRAGAITDLQVKRIAEYAASHPEIHEIILSGGDPLTLSDERLGRILDTLQATVHRADPGRTVVFRLATRMPVVLPQRLTGDLAALLAGYAPLFVITQFNHPNEITEQSRRAVAELVQHGLPVLNQAVLLKGVNDSVDVLASLFQRLLDIRVKPYYLFQGDLAAGTAHFRVPLSRGFQLMRELRQRISGLAMPVYAVDLPGGGGKIPLIENYLHGSRGSNGSRADTGSLAGWYRFTGPDGRNYYYPEEPS